MRRARLFAAISAAALCISMMGNVPMVNMAQESVEVEADAEVDTEVEDTAQEEIKEAIIEDEEPCLTAVTGDWTYSDNDDGTITIKKYTGSDTEIMIPSVIDGKLVTGIGSFAFFDCRSLTRIEIPEGITTIGTEAFLRCRSLTSIEIPSSVTDIQYYVFADCSNMTSVNVDKNNVNYKSEGGMLYDINMTTLICCPAGISGTVEIPSSVTKIAGGAFWGCSSVTGIEIPSGVTSIENFAFYGCRSLTSIKIPSGVTSIWSHTFEDCSKLISIEIPSGVTTIGDEAFKFCWSLTNIKIPSSVTSIESSAFYDCTSLTGIEIPSSVTSIGDYAFKLCSGLTSIEIPSSVTSIGEYAFNGCRNLTTIKIPPSVTSIGKNAFSRCDNPTICGTANSAAETYAKENNIPFVPLCEESDLSRFTVIADSVTYNGDYQNAELYILYENNKYPLVEGVNYTGTVRRKAAGTTTVTIKGKGYYTGETTVSFTVNPLNLKNALEAGDVVLTATDLEYTGRLQQSTVKVTYKGRTLTEGTDYTLKGNGRKAVGTSWAVVTGTGNYTGTIKVKYAMKKATQSNMMVYTKDKRAVDVRTKGATIQLATSRVRDGAKIVYSVEKPNQGITVSQDGKVTVKKGTKPGKYRIKVLAESTPYYKATSKYFTVVVK